MSTKTIKSSSNSQTGVVVSENNVRITSKEDNGVTVDERGVTIQGPVSFVSNTSHMRFGGLWMMNNAVNLSLPSSISTPTPTLKVSPPIGQFKKLMKDANVMMQLLGMVQ